MGIVVNNFVCWESVLEDIFRNPSNVSASKFNKRTNLETKITLPPAENRKLSRPGSHVLLFSLGFLTLKTKERDKEVFMPSDAELEEEYAKSKPINQEIMA